MKTDGIDLDVVWKWNMKEYGNLTTEFQWTHIFNFSKTLGGIDVQVRRHVRRLRRVVGLGARRRTAGTSSSAGTRGPWNVTGTVRYVSG